jgi:DNA modification methylase
MIEVLQGDCREVMAAMAAASFDAIVTDPPYGVGLKYGSWDDSFSAWCDLMDQTVPEMLRVASGPVVVFGANPPQYVARMLTLQPDRMLIWNPSFSLSKSRSNGIFFRWHPIFCWRLPKRHAGPAVDVLHDNCDGHNWWDHPGTKPLALMTSLLGLVPFGGRVLDPFMGSGTTLVAAQRMGLGAVGIELDEGYCEIARKRLAHLTSPEYALADEQGLFAEAR